MTYSMAYSIIVILVIWLVVLVIGFDDSDYGWKGILPGIIVWAIGTVIYLIYLRVI